MCLIASRVGLGALLLAALGVAFDGAPLVWMAAAWAVVAVAAFSAALAGVAP